jgi:Mn-dependent DtxR family transcriptional regulator
MVMGFELRTAIHELTRDAPYTTRNEVHDRYFPDVSQENVDKTLLNLAMDGLVTSWPYPAEKGDRMVALTEEGRTLAIRPPRATE